MLNEVQNPTTISTTNIGHHSHTKAGICIRNEISSIRFKIYLNKIHHGVYLKLVYRVADKSLVRKRKKQAPPVKSVMGRGMN